MTKRIGLLMLITALWLSACSMVEAPPLPDERPPNEDVAGVMPPVLMRGEQPPAELLAPFAAPITAAGDVLLLYGQVLGTDGEPLPDATVEIWQTDASGVYDHPNDPGTAQRDQAFQFFGAVQTDAAGWYAFRTILPGEYEPRPRHIHYKVKQGDDTLLTSQFYFSDDVMSLDALADLPPITEGDMLLSVPVAEDGDQLLASAPIVVGAVSRGAGSLPLTPSQAEGPYYPVTPVAEYDNDLAVR